MGVWKLIFLFNYGDFKVPATSCPFFPALVEEKVWNNQINLIALCHVVHLKDHWEPSEWGLFDYSMWIYFQRPNWILMIRPIYRR